MNWTLLENGAYYSGVKVLIQFNDFRENNISASIEWNWTKFHILILHKTLYRYNLCTYSSIRLIFAYHIFLIGKYQSLLKGLGLKLLEKLFWQYLKQQRRPRKQSFLVNHNFNPKVLLVLSPKSVNYFLGCYITLP